MNNDMYSETRKEGILPCPFCGHPAFAYAIKPHKHYIVDLPDHNGSAFVECSGCNAAMSGATLEEACAAWNKRADPCWCKDCKYYHDEVCVNATSDWVADYPSPYGSCEHCERKKEAAPHEEQPKAEKSDH